MYVVNRRKARIVAKEDAIPLRVRELGRRRHRGGRRTYTVLKWIPSNDQDARGSGVGGSNGKTHNAREITSVRTLVTCGISTNF